MTRPDQVQTLLGVWMEQIRGGRLHTIRDMQRVTGLASDTIIRARRVTRRPNRATRAALGRYLSVDGAVVLALWQTTATYDVSDMRTQQRRTRGLLSSLSQLLDTARTERRQTLSQVATLLGICTSTMYNARRVDRVMRAGTWRKLAGYVGSSVEECKELASSPAVRGTETYPVLTFNGVKWHPMVPAVPCGQCPFCEPCMRDVVADDFAWCEAVIAEDF